MKITEKPAKYSKSRIYDGETISRLNSILYTNQRVIPHLKEGDTTPNHDGYLELIDASGYPEGTLFVQVKTLHKSRINKKISYRFKNQNFFAYCSVPRENSILFIGVDRKSNVAYWEEITPAFVKEQKGNTLYLPKQNIISAGNNDYHKYWLEICKIRQKAIEFYQNNKEQINQPPTKKTKKKKVSVTVVEDAKQKLKDLFVVADLKYKYYYPFIDLLQPFFIDKRGEEQRKKLRQLFDITQKMESGFMEKMINDKLVKIIGESLCFVIDQEKAQALQKEMIDKGAIDLSTIIELF